MTYNVFSGTLNPTHFTSLHFHTLDLLPFWEMLFSSWFSHTQKCLNSYCTGFSWWCKLWVLVNIFYCHSWLLSKSIKTIMGAMLSWTLCHIFYSKAWKLNNGVLTEQDEAVEEKVTALLSSSVVSGLADANWKERLSAMEKMTDVCLCSHLLMADIS